MMMKNISVTLPKSIAITMTALLSFHLPCICFPMKRFRLLSTPLLTNYKLGDKLLRVLNVIAPKINCNYQILI